MSDANIQTVNNIYNNNPADPTFGSKTRTEHISNMSTAKVEDLACSLDNCEDLENWYIKLHTIWVNMRT